MKARLAGTLAELEVLQGRQEQQLELRLENLLEGVRRVQTRAAQQADRQVFDEYRQWVEDTMTTEPQPYIRVARRPHTLSAITRTGNRTMSVADTVPPSLASPTKTSSTATTIWPKSSRATSRPSSSAGKPLKTKAGGAKAPFKQLQACSARWFAQRQRQPCANPPKRLAAHRNLHQPLLAALGYTVQPSPMRTAARHAAARVASIWRAGQSPATAHRAELPARPAKTTTCSISSSPPATTPASLSPPTAFKK
jgi:hypothetical protein